MKGHSSKLLSPLLRRITTGPNIEQLDTHNTIQASVLMHLTRMLAKVILSNQSPLLTFLHLGVGQVWSCAELHVAEMFLGAAVAVASVGLLDVVRCAAVSGRRVADRLVVDGDESASATVVEMACVEMVSGVCVGEVDGDLPAVITIWPSKLAVQV